MPHQPPARRLRRLLCAGGVGLALVTGVLAAGPVAADGASRSEPQGPTVVTDGHGRVRLVAAPAGRRLSSAPRHARTPVAAARAQLRGQVDAFGVAGPVSLRALDASRPVGGHHVVRFQQTVGGVPVLGGQLVAVLDRGLGLVSVGGELARRAADPTYVLPASTAERAARRTVARAYGLSWRGLTAARPTRAVLDPSLLTPGAPSRPRPVWQVLVRATDRLDVAQRVLVDARTGRVALRLDEVHHLLDRVVCDQGNRPGGDESCRPPGYTRVEGQGPTGIPDVDQAYDLTGVTAAWWAGQLGVDLTALIGHDAGDGVKLRSTTRYCGPEGCPLQNAFWNGEQMVYGEGFTSADDVVAHELAHGVSQNTAGLIYWYQSGAINESMSDVFGELVDLADGVGTDTDEARWLLGEDLAPAAGGVARDMADPTVFGQPDHTGSELYDFAPDYDDNGGVHTNSGVPNKAAYLIADGTVGEPGGAFNGYSFAGIGTTKTALVHWAALNLLTPGADFVDLAAALQAGCSTLAASGAGGTTPQDCATVTAATAATGLTRWASPSPPRDVRMRPGARSLLLTWSRPASSGSSPVSSYAVWVRPAPQPEEDFVALEPTSRAFVVEGLKPGIDYTVGLVAVTADGTSAPVTRRFSGSALRVQWPAALTYGEPLRLRGVLAGSGERALAGRAVVLLRRFGGSDPLREIARDQTAGDGTFRLRAPARRRASYVLVHLGSGRVLGDRTAARSVAVRQAVTVSSDPALRSTRQPRLRGTVRPARPGAVVRLQRGLAEGGWVTVARDRLDGAGRYELAAPAPAPAGTAWRVVVAAAPRAGLAAGVSRVVTTGRT